MATQIKIFSNPNQARLPISQQILLLEKIAQLLDQGYSILEAIDVLRWHHRWDHILDQLSNQLEDGQKFDQILAELHFDHKIVSFIYFALQHGNLIQAIRQCVDFIKQQIDLFNKFKQSIRYPIVLISFFLIILFFVDLYVYPAFLQLYSTNSYSSNFLFISIKCVKIIFKLLYFLVITLFILFLSWLFLKDKLTIKQKAQGFNLLAISSFFSKKYTSLMFAIHLSSLLEAGLSFKTSLTLMVNHNKETLLSYYCSFLLTDLENGISLNQSLKKHHCFDDSLTYLFEKKANRSIIKRDLLTYATLSLEQLQRLIIKIIKLIQPTVFVCIAISIILIYLSILIPMLELIQTI
ncbi:type II secretion system F family protein [Amphibacillus sp. MSJ-3]|uniref:competence type IV pilus assembly protein ComGB n=1 Tax=Amphibacillus sp. MSJ-3 TaxID=2841505 RepID=UPI001C0F0CDE|nr:competence type IV pilus assembly protein ComGB [Amphibacillus sp. MSJ-3]MBU5594778.1 type II secretion system F family protein [Amphibacillus sp. MSJ-3]